MRLPRLGGVRWRWPARTLPRTAALRLAEAGLCAAATAVAGLPYAAFFASAGYLAPLTAAALAAAAVAAVGAVRGWRPVTTTLVSCAGLLLLAVFGVYTSTLRYGIPTTQTARALGSGVTQGWIRMLTVGVPADVTSELLITPVVLAWVASFVAAMLALRGRSVLAPTVPALVPFVVALAYVAGQSVDHIAVTAGFALATLVLVLLRANRLHGPDFDTAVPPQVETLGLGWRRDSGGIRLRRLARGVPLVAGLAGLTAACVWVAPQTTDTDRFDPRTIRAPRLDLAESVTPLSTVKGQLKEEPPRQLFTVRLPAATATAAPPTDRIRLAALDRYDGALWSSADSYLLAGRRLAGNSSGLPDRRLTEHVEITGLRGPYLPVVGWPLRLTPPHRAGGGSAGKVWFSERSGLLVTDASSVDGLRYDVVGATTAPNTDLSGARPAAGIGSLALPADTPEWVPALARQITAGQTSPYGKLSAIEQYLRALPYSLDAPPGHSYGALATMLTGAGTSDRDGYAEQHAAAFAVLARAAGFPARVAVGYLLRNGAGGAYTVTTRDAHAWAEVDFAGYGWVPFEPTDTSRLPTHPHDARLPTAPAPESTSAPGTGLATAGTGAQRRPPSDLGAPDGGRNGTGAAPASGDRSWLSAHAPLVAGAAGAALLVVLLAFAGLTLGAKAWVRRRRRNATGPAARVVGAWQEATDRLVEFGFTASPSLTPAEVADGARSLGPATGAVALLAPTATAALFAPTGPDTHAAETAWALEARLRADLYAGHGRLARLRSRLDPRPLLVDWRARRSSRRQVI